MTPSARIPTWLRVAAVAIVGQDVAALLTSPITGVSIAWLLIGVFLAWFLLRGSRVAWVLAALSAAAQISAPLTLNGSAWLAVTAIIVLACLLAPSSRNAVWSERQWPVSDLRDSEWAVFGWLAHQADKLATRGATPGRGKVLLVLALCIAVLYPLVGALSNFHEGSAHGSVIVDVLWRVVWIGFSLLELALILLLIATVSRYGSRLTRGRKSSAARSKT
jgi:hypothetical protein